VKENVFANPTTHIKTVSAQNAPHTPHQVQTNQNVYAQNQMSILIPPNGYVHPAQPTPPQTPTNRAVFAILDMNLLALSATLSVNCMKYTREVNASVLITTIENLVNVPYVLIHLLQAPIKQDASVKITKYGIHPRVVVLSVRLNLHQIKIN
jgi:hypothetical protein